MVCEDSQLYGIDWDGPISFDEDVIIVPETFHPLIDSDVQELKNTIVPSAYSHTSSSNPKTLCKRFLPESAHYCLFQNKLLL